MFIDNPVISSCDNAASWRTGNVSRLAFIVGFGKFDNKEIKRLVEFKIYFGGNGKSIHHSCIFRNLG